MLTQLASWHSYHQCSVLYSILLLALQQQRREKELRKQQEREQRRHYEEQMRREEERRRAEHEQVQTDIPWTGNMEPHRYPKVYSSVNYLLAMWVTSLGLLSLSRCYSSSGNSSHFLIQKVKCTTLAKVLIHSCFPLGPSPLICLHLQIFSQLWISAWKRELYIQRAWYIS